MRRLAVLTILALFGCSGEATAPVVLPPFPTDMQLEAFAEGVSGGRNIQCRLDFLVRAEPAGDHFWGSAGGEAYRESLDDTGAGIAFWADAAMTLRINVSATADVSLISYVSDYPMPPVDDSRFWDGLRRFDGRVDTRGIFASGPWTCHPMDTRGDTFGSVEGSWRLVTVEVPPA